MDDYLLKTLCNINKAISENESTISTEHFDYSDLSFLMNSTKTVNKQLPMVVSTFRRNHNVGGIVKVQRGWSEESGYQSSCSLDVVPDRILSFGNSKKDSAVDANAENTQDSGFSLTELTTAIHESNSIIDSPPLVLSDQTLLSINFEETSSVSTSAQSPDQDCGIASNDEESPVNTSPDNLPTRPEILTVDTDEEEQEGASVLVPSGKYLIIKINYQH